MLTPPNDERRLIAASVAASVALHAAVLALAPRYAHEPPVEPPQVLSVVLVDASSAVPETAAPEPPPPPPARRPATQPAPRAAAAPAPRARAEAPSPAAPPAYEAKDASPALDSGPSEERPAVAQAPAAAPAPAVAAAAARESLSPPDFRAGYLRNPPPGYPAAARRNGEEGTVTLRVRVSTDGAPREVVLERSSGSGHLDAAALATVKTWRFTPARRGGEAQEAWVLVPIVFRLEPRG